MLNAQYFRTAFADAVRQNDPRHRVELHLRTGAVYEGTGVHEVDDGFVSLDVLPPEEADLAAQRARAGAAAAPTSGETDRLVVSYESISCVHVTPASRAAVRTAGF